MNFSFKISNFSELKKDILNYYEKNKILADAYWEHFVLNSNFYKILVNDCYSGFFAIYGETTLTIFHIFDNQKEFSQEIFLKVKKMEQVSKAFLPTGDEFFLSHCIDDFTTIEKNGYFTKDYKNNSTNENNLTMEVATKKHKDIILEFSNNFFSNIDNELSQGYIYMVKKDDLLIGFGHYVPGVVLPHYLSIGMFVIKEHRSKGYGTKILHNLKKLAYAEGKKPIAGCYYYNHNSLKTQLKAGNRCSTRLLTINF